MKNLTFLLCIISFCFAFFSSCKPQDPTNEPTVEKRDPNTIAAENLIAYFPFDVNGVDIVGGLEPAKEGNVAYVGGKTNKAYKGQKGAYLLYELPLESELRTLNDGFTIAVWVRNSRVPSNKLHQILEITRGDYVQNGNLSWRQQELPANREGLFFQWMYQGYDTTYWINQSRNDYANEKFIPNEWMHIVMVCDVLNKSISIYKDGEEVRELSGTVENMRLNFNNADRMIIGSWIPLVYQQKPKKWMEWFDGNLDELRIYNRGLTIDEVKSLYEAEITLINQ